MGSGPIKSFSKGILRRTLKCFFFFVSLVEGHPASGWSAEPDKLFSSMLLHSSLWGIIWCTPGIQNADHKPAAVGLMKSRDKNVETVWTVSVSRAGLLRGEIALLELEVRALLVGGNSPVRPLPNIRKHFITPSILFMMVCKTKEDIKIRINEINILSSVFSSPCVYWPNFDLCEIFWSSPYWLF